MNALDWLVLLGTMVGIAAYGTWRTRHTDNLNTYLKGSRSTKWGTIGLSIMATQASTITYLSLPGQAYESGIAFIQNYFGLPIALIIVCAIFLPIYRKLGVYTAYEYLGKRFDTKTRLLGAGIFLLQRGVQGGIVPHRRRHGAGGVACRRLLDLDHVRAEVAEQHGGVGAGDVAREVEDPHAGEGAHAACHLSRTMAKPIPPCAHTESSP